MTQNAAAAAVQEVIVILLLELLLEVGQGAVGEEEQDEDHLPGDHLAALEVVD